MWRPNLVLFNRLKPLSLAALVMIAAAAQAAPSDDLRQAQKAVRMQDFDKAFALYKSMANDGDPEAQYRLANFYLQGIAVAKNPKQAQSWLEKAAAQGLPEAQYALAQLVQDKQPERAEELLNASAKQGYRAAKLLLEQGTPVHQPTTTDGFEEQWFGAARKNDPQILQRLNQQQSSINLTDDHNRTALFYAIESASVPAAEWLLKEGAEINHRDKFGLTPLHAAINRQHKALTKMLLDKGADTSIKLTNGDTLLHFALRREFYPIIESLIAAGVPINELNQQGWSALDLAEFKKAARTTQLLKSKGAIKGETWREQRQAQDVARVAQQLSNANLPPVALAIMNDNEALLNKLVKQDRGVLDTQLRNGTTLLMLAVRHQKPNMIKALLRHGSNVRQTGHQGKTALHVATTQKDTAAINLLLGAGASPIQKDDSGEDAIMAALAMKHLDVANVLIDNLLGRGRSTSEARVHLRTTGVPVDQYILRATQHSLVDIVERLLPYKTDEVAVDAQGRDALWFAANAENAKLILKLLKADLPADREDNLGRTPLYVAVDRGCLECARQLLGFVDINHQTNSGNTALMRASAKGNALLVAWLLQNKAKVDLRNQRGNTALMEAVNANSIDAVRHLLRAKASVTRKNKLGFSAIDLAKQTSPQMLQLVESGSVMGLF